MDRSHSFSDRRRSLPIDLTLPAASFPQIMGSASASAMSRKRGSLGSMPNSDRRMPFEPIYEMHSVQGRQNVSAPGVEGGVFETTDPFATIPPRRVGQRVGSTARPPLSPLGASSWTRMCDPESMSQAMDTKEVGHEDVARRGERRGEELARQRRDTRMWSFEDMLAGGPERGGEMTRVER